MALLRNFSSFKEAKNKCYAINKEANRHYIEEATKYGDNIFSTYFITIEKDDGLKSSEKKLLLNYLMRITLT